VARAAASGSDAYPGSICDSGPGATDTGGHVYAATTSTLDQNLAGRADRISAAAVARRSGSAVVSGKREVCEDTAARRVACRHNATVRLYGHTIRDIRGAVEVGRDPAVTVKGRVQSPVTIVSGESNVRSRTGISCSARCNHASVSLYCHAECYVGTAAEI